MSLSAFTNAVGFHERFERKSAFVSGRRDYDFDNVYESYHEPHHTSDVRMEWSWKGDTVKGDRKTPYQYLRAVRKVIKDVPRLTFRRLYGGDHLIYEETFETYGSQAHGTLNWAPPSGPLEDNARAESNTKALNKLSGEKASLGAELAQARQTIDMFSSNVSQLTRALLAAKRGRWGEVPGHLGLSKKDLGSGKTTANRWLEMQYGWLPLMGSIHDLQGVVHQAMLKERLIRGIGTGTAERSGQDYTWDFIRSWTCVAQSRTHLTAKLDNAPLRNLNSAGLINPLSVAWEVVPWSFAIDWFVPVGATLEATTATLGLNFERGYRTRKTSSTVTRSFTPRWFDPNDYDTENGFYEEQHFWMERERLYGFPSPEFYADMTPFSTPRALNALALFRQLFR